MELRNQDFEKNVKEKIHQVPYAKTNILSKDANVSSTNVH